MGKRSCDSDDVMNPGFGASVETAEGVQSEFEKDFDVQLQYKVNFIFSIFDSCLLFLFSIIKHCQGILHSPSTKLKNRKR